MGKVCGNRLKVI